MTSTAIRAQTYLLLDRKWHKPAIESDTVTRANLSDGLFPIYRQDIDTLLLLVSKFKNLKSDGLRRKFYYSPDFKTDRFEFEIENIKRTYGDGYEINLISIGSYGRPTLKLSDPRNNLPENERVIRAFISYLERTKKNMLKQSRDRKLNSKNNPFNN
jgi:hypothetical protein